MGVCINCGKERPKGNIKYCSIDCRFPSRLEYKHGAAKYAREQFVKIVGGELKKGFEKCYGAKHKRAFPKGK